MAEITQVQLNALENALDKIFNKPSLHELNFSELAPDIILIACCL